MLCEGRFDEGGDAVVGRDVAHVDEDFHVGEQRRVALVLASDGQHVRLRATLPGQRSFHDDVARIRNHRQQSCQSNSTNFI